MSTSKRKTSESPVSVPEQTYTEVALTFEGLSVSSDWFHPELSSMVCALCGKKCIEKGKTMCVNANPFCG
jgi:hypothetical protein